MNISDLVHRREPSMRKKMYAEHVYTYIQKYIKSKNKGDLDLEYTPIIKLPENLNFVNGSLDLSYSTIEHLNSNLQIKVSLDLMYTPLKKLPENLRIGKNLYISNSNISKLPTSLRICGKIFCKNSTFQKKHSTIDIKFLQSLFNCEIITSI